MNERAYQLADNTWCLAPQEARTAAPGSGPDAGATGGPEEA